MGAPIGGAAAIEEYARENGIPLGIRDDHPRDTEIPNDMAVQYVIEGDYYVKIDGEDPVKLNGGGASSRWSENANGALEPDTGSISVDEDEASITNETHVRMARASDSSSQTSGTYVNVYDTELKDNRGELNGSQQFVPDETGLYDIVIGVRMGVTAGDSIVARVVDVDTGNTANGGRSEEHAASSLEEAVFPLPSINLTAGQTYELQVADIDNSFTVNSTDFSIGMIRRSLVS